MPDFHETLVVQDARRLASLLGELVLVDRALRDGARLVGKEPRAVLTVENLGAYQDAVVSDDVLVPHVPGWNTRTTRDLLKGLDEVPVIRVSRVETFTRRCAVWEAGNRRTGRATMALSEATRRGEML